VALSAMRLGFLGMPLRPFVLLVAISVSYVPNNRERARSPLRLNR
jgi:hypothetical protein